MSNLERKITIITEKHSMVKHKESIHGGTYMVKTEMNDRTSLKIGRFKLYIGSDVYIRIIKTFPTLGVLLKALITGTMPAEWYEYGENKDRSMCGAILKGSDTPFVDGRIGRVNFIDWIEAAIQ